MKSKNYEALQAAVKGDRKQFEELTSSPVTYYFIEGKYYREELDSEISQKEFESQFRPGTDSLFESEGSKHITEEEIRALGFNPDDFRHTAHSPEESVKVINDLIDKLENK